MKNSRFRGIVLNISFVLMFINSPSFGGDSILITDAHFEDGNLILNGASFDSFGPPNISIGDTLLSLCEVTSSTITCDISGTVAEASGTWRVTVSAGNSPHSNATIDAFNQIVTTQGCISGDFNECYQGEVNTQGVGICQSGKRVCNWDGQWDSICQYQVLPDDETPFAGNCANALDDDCDGLIDGEDNDCCSPSAEICDGRDNDCDGVADNDLACSGIGTCSDPIVIEVVNGTYISTYAFDFTQAASDISLPNGGCTNYTTAGPEIVTMFTFSSASTVEFNYWSDGDASMYIVSDCRSPQESCLAGSDYQSRTGHLGLESVGYTGSAGETVYVILDNYNTTVTEGHLEMIILSP